MTAKPRLPQTLTIDKEIISLSGKKKPRLLFIPTASLDDAAYCEAIHNLYASLGCFVDMLLLYRDRPIQRAIKEKIINSDIIYVGGGNTLRMMKFWRQLHVDRYLNQARLGGAVLCGLSAGALCWFRQGSSDSRRFADAQNLTLIKVTGLHFFNALICPHYDVEKHRQPALKKMMRTTPGVAIALDNCAAIEIVDDQYRIITSARRKNAYKIFWHRGKYHKQTLEKNSCFRSVEELLVKQG